MGSEQSQQKATQRRWLELDELVHRHWTIQFELSSLVQAQVEQQEELKQEERWWDHVDNVDFASISGMPASGGRRCRSRGNGLQQADSSSPLEREVLGDPWKRKKQGLRLESKLETKKFGTRKMKQLRMNPGATAFESGCDGDFLHQRLRLCLVLSGVLGDVLEVESLSKKQL
jgi:hypothetical protein